MVDSLLLPLLAPRQDLVRGLEHVHRPVGQGQRVVLRVVCVLLGHEHGVVDA